MSRSVTNVRGDAVDDDVAVDGAVKRKVSDKIATIENYVKCDACIAPGPPGVDRGMDGAGGTLVDERRLGAAERAPCGPISPSSALPEVIMKRPQTEVRLIFRTPT